MPKIEGNLIFPAGATVVKRPIRQASLVSEGGEDLVIQLHQFSILVYNIIKEGSLTIPIPENWGRIGRWILGRQLGYEGRGQDYTVV